MFDRCTSDLDEAKESHWNHHYGFKAEDVNMPQVGSYTYWATEDSHEVSDTSFTVGMVFALLLGGASIATYAMAEYYYWGFGMQIGYFVSNLIVAIDYWGDYGVFHPEVAHERYLPDDGH